MSNQDILQKLRRLHTLLVLGKRSNTLALAIRRAIEEISSWKVEASVLVAQSPIRRIFAGYGPKFIRIFTELIQTGNITMIQELQPEFPVFFCFLCEIPGIGETMARRMFFERSIQSMDDLRIAYTNNVLQKIPAFGDSRLRAIEIILWNSQSDASVQNYWNSDSEASLDIILENNLPALEKNNDREDEYKDSDPPSTQYELFPQKSLKLPEPASDIAEHAPHDVSDKDEPVQSDVSNNSAPSDDSLSMDTPLTAAELSLASICLPLEAQSVHPNSPSSNPSYSKEFIESNSSLFRENPKLPTKQTEPVQDYHEDDLNEVLEALSTPSYDPQIASELENFIAQDLREHERLPDSSSSSQQPEDADEIHANLLHVQILRADHIEANIIRANLIRAETILIQSKNTPILSSESIDRETLDVSLVQADTIHADIIEVRCLTAHYIDAKIIG